MSLTRNPKQETSGKSLLLFTNPGRNVKQAIGQSMQVRCTEILTVKEKEKILEKIGNAILKTEQGQPSTSVANIG